MVGFENSSIDYLIPRPVNIYHGKTYDRIAPSKTTFNAKGKSVLITAGATGIGFSISKAFAEAGVERIIIVSRRPEPQSKAKAQLESQFQNMKVETISCTITDSANMAQMMERAGDIDVLVLCAAAVGGTKPILQTESSQIEDIFGTNVTACFDLVKTYLSLPPPASGSRTIINVSSASAHVYIPGQAVYAASKAAFAEMLSFFAGEFTPEKDGVRVFSIHPGVFYTDDVAKNYPKDAIEWEDINLPGHFCVWLASPEADFLHGRFVWAHWDVDEMIEVKERIEKDPFYLKIGLMQ